ncbi:MAG: ABC transporter ATP-binding protein [Pyrinomonadaceae bacterium]
MKETIVALEKVCKTFDGADHVRALDGIDLAMPRGQRVAIMGPSGSGKSTLLNIICGLDIPTSGRVAIDGSDLAAMNDDDRTRLRRQRIGMIFQTFNLMPTLTGVENVSLPLRLDGVRSSDADERARTILSRVGLTDRLDHKPDEMSGGERQRVAIARALVFDPPLLLADEPTGNLDSATGEEILHLLDDVHSEFDTTIILVTHNEQAAEQCERQIRLLDGRIVEDTGN